MDFYASMNIKWRVCGLDTCGVIQESRRTESSHQPCAIDLFNRQLHPDERASIDRRKSNYAKRYGLTVAQAEQELMTQANLMLQNGSPGTWNERAAGFLREHTGLLPADGNSGTGYMFFATPEQRANTAMYAGYYPNGEGVNLPLSGDVAHSVDRQNAYQNSYEAMTWGAAVGAATIAVGGPAMALPGAPIFSSGGALGSGALASPVGTGAISATINATAQYAQNGNINSIDVGSAFMTGAAGSYGGLLWNVGVNTFGGATTTAVNNVLQGRSDSIMFGAVAGGAASIFGYGAGSLADRAFSGLLRPTINGSASWAEVGKWAGPSGRNLFIPNNWPVVGASIGGGIGAEATTSAINEVKGFMGQKK